MISTFVFQGSWKDLLGKLRIVAKQQKVAAAATIGKRNHFWTGVVPCLGATLLSGLAGAFSQKSLQIMHRDAYLYTVEISFLSAICLIVSTAFRRRKEISANSKQNEVVCNSSFFEHWDCKTLLPIVTKASAGVLTALVHSHLGSVIKGFALVLGLVFSALLQFVLEGEDLTLEQLVGTALVLLSSWLHFKSSSR
jgi:UDP-sugar transporter A1/2/3